MLTVVWGGALAGVALSTLWPHAPRWVSAPLYLILGWAAIPILPDIPHAGGSATLIMLAAGGVGYSVGAVLFAWRRPNPWPDSQSGSGADDYPMVPSASDGWLVAYEERGRQGGYETREIRRTR